MLYLSYYPVQHFLRSSLCYMPDQLTDPTARQDEMLPEHSCVSFCHMLIPTPYSRFTRLGTLNNIRKPQPCGEPCGKETSTPQDPPRSNQPSRRHSSLPYYTL